MKLIKPNFEIWEPHEGKDGYLKDIERAARICYKSENKITEDSYKKIVDSLIVSGHGAALEHGTVYLELDDIFLDPKDPVSYGSDLIGHYRNNKYSKVMIIGEVKGNDSWKADVYITTNYRVIVENNWSKGLRYLCKPTPAHYRRVSVKFICSRAIAQEFTRHRAFSFMMESQRYCNYSKDKFDNNVTFIIPEWANFEEDEYTKPFSRYYGLTGTTAEALWYNSCFNSEDGYRTLLQEGRKPQEAREVLVNSCKTELVMTGFIEDWKHFFELRCANNAHPEARRLAIPLKEEFIKRELIKE